MRQILAILILLAVAPAAADNAARSARLRGTIEQVSGDAVTILTRDGQHQTVLIGPDTRIGALRALAPDDVKAGDFIVTAVLKASDSHFRALEVRVLPEPMRDAGER